MLKALCILISNTGDHLRNHAFLYEGQKGRCLSPACDLNPVPIDLEPRALVIVTAITDDDNTASLALAVRGRRVLRDLDQKSARDRR